jgi:hypothetical protein
MRTGATNGGWKNKSNHDIKHLATCCLSIVSYRPNWREHQFENDDNLLESFFMEDGASEWHDEEDNNKYKLIGFHCHAANCHDTSCDTLAL